MRTDSHQLRPVAGDTAQVQAVKVVTRAHKTLIWERTRHTQRLRHALRDYFPAALLALKGTVALSDRSTRAGLICPPRSPAAGLGARFVMVSHRDYGAYFAALSRGEDAPCLNATVPLMLLGSPQSSSAEWDSLVAAGRGADRAVLHVAAANLSPNDPVIIRRHCWCDCACWL